MRSVSAMRQELEQALGKYREDPRLIVKHALCALLPRGIPHWVSPSMRAELGQLGLRPVPAAVGTALGVITRGAEAQLLQVEVRRRESAGIQEFPTPLSLSAESAMSLWAGAHAALQLYPDALPIEPRLELEFRLYELGGQELSTVEPIIGGSLALAALVAAWSCLCGRPPREGVVYTGALEGDVVAGVADVAQKHAEALAAGFSLVLPLTNAKELRVDEGSRPVMDAGEVLAEAFGPDWAAPTRCPRPTQGDALLAYERLDLLRRNNVDARRWPELAARFESFSTSQALPRAKRLRALACAVSCLTHCDRLAGTTLARLKAELELLGPEELDSMDEVEARTHLASAYRDAYLFDDAIQEAEKAWTLARNLRLHGEAAKARSSLGQILAASGRHEEGLGHVQVACKFFEERGSSECPRNHTYVVDALCRMGQVEEAKEEYLRGLNHNEERNPLAQQKMNRAFLDYALLNGRLRRLRVQAAPADWESLRADSLRALEGVQGDWPRTGLERVHAAAALRCVEDPSERERLLCAAAERTCARREQPLLRWQSGMVMLEASLAELERGGDSAAAVSWARAGLRVLPGRRARRFLRAGRVLRARSAQEVREAVSSILEAEQY